jgi:hypothetical protein
MDSEERMEMLEYQAEMEYQDNQDYLEREDQWVFLVDKALLESRVYLEVEGTGALRVI